jgi:hypothetical protein
MVAIEKRILMEKTVELGMISIYFERKGEKKNISRWNYWTSWSTTEKTNVLG